jgi:hypothetical protein
VRRFTSDYPNPLQEKLKAGARSCDRGMGTITDEGSIAGIKLGTTQAHLMARALAKTEGYGEGFQGNQVWGSDW